MATSVASFINLEDQQVVEWFLKEYALTNRNSARTRMMHLRHEATRLVQEIQAVEKSNGGRRDGSYFDETAVRERNAATATKSLALEVISGAFYNLSAVKELERSQMEDDQREFAAAKRWLVSEARKPASRDANLISYEASRALEILRLLRDWDPATDFDPRKASDNNDAGNGDDGGSSAVVGTPDAWQSIVLDPTAREKARSEAAPAPIMCGFCQEVTGCGAGEANAPTVCFYPKMDALTQPYGSAQPYASPSPERTGYSCRRPGCMRAARIKYPPAEHVVTVQDFSGRVALGGITYRELDTLQQWLTELQQGALRGLVPEKPDSRAAAFVSPRHPAERPAKQTPKAW